jgi:aspartyl-tRNA(Asn)/glutamyl-tRNA(Gln) amidotransferase subunit C
VFTGIRGNAWHKPSTRMRLTEKDVRYVAALANLNLSDEETGQMLHDLDGILAQMDALAEIDTEGVAPMLQVLFGGDDAANDTARLRADVERPTLDNEVALANAPMSGEGYFKVPKVIER